MRTRNPAGRSGFLNNLLGFISALAAFVESRLGLLAAESKVAAMQLFGVLACLVGALLFFAVGYVFLIVGVVAWIATLINVSWTAIALSAAGIHFVLVLVFLVGARVVIKKPLFRALGAELKKDREWLRNLDQTTTPTN